jgi:hypothetical protein
MTRFFLLASLTFLGFGLAAAPPARATAPSRPYARQSQQATTSVAGTVASIADDGHSFTVVTENEGQNGGKQTMRFVLNKDSHVQGEVRVGVAVTVEYVALADQNLAITVVVKV